MAKDKAKPFLERTFKGSFLPFAFVFRTRATDVIDDWICFYARVLLFAFFLITTAYVSLRPIACATPPEFPAPWVAYSSSLCFIKERHTFVESVYSDNKAVHKERIYQFLPYLFFVHSMLLGVPLAFWLCFSNSTNLPLDDLMEEIEQIPEAEIRAEKDDKKEKTERFDTLVNELKTLLHERNGMSPLAKSRLVIAFVAHKFFSLFVLMSLLIYITWLTDNTGLFWAPNKSFRMMFGEQWDEFKTLPRKIHCTVERMIASRNIQNYEVECVLMANMLVEKFVFIVAHLYAVLAVLAFINVGLACLRFLRPHGLFSMAISIIQAQSVETSDNEQRGDEMLHDFVEMCGPDVVLLFYLAQRRASGVVTRRLARTLCADFARAHKSRASVRTFSHRLSVAAHLEQGGVHLRNDSTFTTASPSVSSAADSNPTFVVSDLYPKARQ